MLKNFDVIIVGGGISGLVTAKTVLHKKNTNILIIEKSNDLCKKLIISGGSKANFSNRSLSYDNYISENPKFCMSALTKFSTLDFINLLNSYNVPFEEKQHGKLFCKNSARDILKILMIETSCARFELNTKVKSIKKDEKFLVETTNETFVSDFLVIATGTDAWTNSNEMNYGITIAKNFGHEIVPISPGLVPLKIDKKYTFFDLAGITVDIKISTGKKNFEDSLLFTHTGISGPAVLQISNYWKEGEKIYINFLPTHKFNEILSERRNSRLTANKVLACYLPAKLAKKIIPSELSELRCADLNKEKIEILTKLVHNYSLTPLAKETNKKAEVMLGGVSLKSISSKDMQSKICERLFFVGEVMDITGQLGGYNIHWAFASANTAGEAIAKLINSKK